MFFVGNFDPVERPQFIFETHFTALLLCPIKLFERVRRQKIPKFENQGLVSRLYLDINISKGAASNEVRV